MKTYKEIQSDVFIKLKEKKKEIELKSKEKTDFLFIKNELEQTVPYWKKLNSFHANFLQEIFQGKTDKSDLENRVRNFMKSHFRFHFFSELKRLSEKEKESVVALLATHIKTLKIEERDSFFLQKTFTKKDRLQQLFKSEKEGILLSEQDEEDMQKIIQNCWIAVLSAVIYNKKKNMFPVYESLFTWMNHEKVKKEKREYKIRIPVVPKEYMIEKNMKKQEAKCIKKYYQDWSHLISTEKAIKREFDKFLEHNFLPKVHYYAYISYDETQIKTLCIENMKIQINILIRQMESKIENIKEWNIGESDEFIKSKLKGVKEYETMIQSIEKTLK